MISWPGANTRFARAVALGAILLAVASACARPGRSTSDSTNGAPSNGGRGVAIPRRGVFPTSVEHFDRVIGSGRLPTVVNAWASWCIPCRSETPLLVKAAGRYAGRIRFLGLNTQDDRKAALEFIDEFGIPYASGLDPKGTVGRHLRILGLPATLFYRPGGELALVHQGEIRASDLNEKIEELLRVSATAVTKSP
ncbi:MAG: TlpA family protein disulfide reductase [Actinomycetota bacterium]